VIRIRLLLIALFVVTHFVVATIFARVPDPPVWVVRDMPCATLDGCLKGDNNLVVCVNQHNPGYRRDVQVTSQTALLLHIGDPCPTS